jgi:hypothetical protein
MTAANADPPEEWRIVLRIVVNLGDVMSLGHLPLGYFRPTNGAVIGLAKGPRGAFDRFDTMRAL